MTKFTANIHGRDMAFRANLDSVGQLYLGLLGSWTLLLLAGIAFLFANRGLQFLRIRNIGLGISAVCVLHVYWMLCMLVYVLNGYFPCGLEFWIMSIYLPLGIGLYQATSTQFLYVAGLQQQYTTSAPVSIEKARARSKGIRGYLQRWRSMKATDRAVLMIGTGMVLTVFLTFLLYFGSRRFHSSYGAWGPRVSATTCRKGWEWWPSIAWQFAWTWLYAPYLLWKIRGIKDVNGWRLQTTLCCLAGLPGSPLWLAALYSPAFKGIDKYWLPPQWFTPGILMMEISVIFLPVYQILRSHRLRKETLDIISEWERKKHKQSQFEDTDSSTTKRASTVGGGSIAAKSTATAQTNSSTSSRRSEMYTMQAFEKALATNPQPLLIFSSMKDFSGENISFLTHIQEWKNAWLPPSPGRTSPSSKFSKKAAPPPPPKDPVPPSTELRRQQFSRALQIYSTFVSTKYSVFPINISSSDLKPLDAFFSAPATLINSSDSAQENSATPFAAWDVESAPSAPLAKNGAQIANAGTAVSESKDMALTELGGGKLPADVEVPEGFGPGVFDSAEKSVKYTVLTNTWPKFVRAGFAGDLYGQGQKDAGREGWRTWLRQRVGRVVEQRGAKSGSGSGSRSGSGSGNSRGLMKI